MSFSDERDYAEEQWQRDDAEREGLAEVEAERCGPAPKPVALDYEDLPPNAGSSS